MKPNTEQTPILAAVRSRSSVRVNASAGTGKTLVIRWMGEQEPDRSMLYVCFTKAIERAAKMPANVTALTQHALAYRTLQIGRTYGSRVGRSLLLTDLKHRFQLASFVDALTVRETLDRYCTSADRWIGPHHVPKERLASISSAEREGVQDQMVQVARQTWQAIINPKERQLGFPHGVYLKLWQAQEGAPLPIPYSLVVADEFQDFTPVQVDAFSRHTGQQVIFGDPHQEIFGWRGTNEAMKALSLDQTFSLSESYRFGPPIAKVANQLLALLPDPPKPLIGVGGPTELLYTPLKPPFTWLFRTNLNLLLEAVKAVRAGLKIHVVRGLTQALNLLEGAWLLYQGEPDRVVDTPMRLLGSWPALVEASEYQHDWKLAVAQVKKDGWGVPAMVAEMRSAGEVPEADADVVFSTIHAAKGREWDRVQIYPDFEDLVYYRPKSRNYGVNREVVMLAYVAATRAKAVLSVGAPYNQLEDLLILTGKSVS